MWEIKADEVFPFRPFIGETVRDINDKILSQTERLPADQILDMYTLSPYFIELPSLAELNDEAAVQLVVSVLQSPRVCEKYPIELGQSCATCRLKDAFTDLPDRIQENLAQYPNLLAAANDAAAKLKDGLSKAIDEARRRVDVAIRDIDDPKSGKSMFFDTDYTNVYHTHADRPQYRTSTQNSNIGQQIADALREFSGPKAEATSPDINAIVAAAVAEAVAKVQAQFEEKAKDAELKKVDVEVEADKVDTEEVVKPKGKK